MTRATNPRVRYESKVFDLEERIWRARTSPNYTMWSGTSATRLPYVGQAFSCFARFLAAEMQPLARCGQLRPISCRTCLKRSRPPSHRCSNGTCALRFTIVRCIGEAAHRLQYRAAPVIIRFLGALAVHVSSSLPLEATFRSLRRLQR